MSPGCGTVPDTGAGFPTYTAGPFPDIHWIRPGNGDRCLRNPDYQALRNYVIRLESVNFKHWCVIRRINQQDCRY